MQRKQKIGSLDGSGNGTVLFDQTDDEYQRVDPAYAHNFVTVVTLDGSGDPVVPTAGTYTVYVEGAPEAGFQSLSNGEISGAGSAGTAGSDGAAESASFDGNPWRVKIVAASLDAGTQFRVDIVQNLR